MEIIYMAVEIRTAASQIRVSTALVNLFDVCRSKIRYCGYSRLRSYNILQSPWLSLWSPWSFPQFR